MANVQIFLTHAEARVPKYSHSSDAGADVCSVQDLTIGPGGHAVVDLGFRMALPLGYEMQVRSRSGLAAKHGVMVLNSPGTIDSGYRGPCKVILQNLGMSAFKVNKGDRIAQFVLKKAPQAHFLEVDEFSVESDRGEGGFGSTGK